MTFPLMPDTSGYIRSAPTYSYIGQLFTSGDGFPGGNLTFTAGTKVIVLSLQLAGGNGASSGVTIGGVACTQACGSTASVNHASIWYLATTASGSLAISGSGGTGRSFLHAYEVRDYTSSAPYSAVAGFTDSSVTSFGINLPTSTNTTVIGAGLSGPVTIAVTPSVGPSVALISNVAYESATTHYSWAQRPTFRGDPTVFTASGTATTHRLAAAAWR